MGLVQAFFTGVNSATNDDGDGEFTSPFNNQNWLPSINESDCAIPVLVNGSFRNFKIVRELAPGAGTSVTYTLRKNSVNTSLAVTIANTDITGQDLINTAQFSVNDKVSLICNYTGGVTPGYTKIYIEFVNSDNNLDSVYGAMISGNANNNEINGIFNSCEDWTNGVTSVCPIDGFVAATSFTLNAAPGGGNSATIVLVKNGIDQDGSGGTPDTRVTAIDAETSAYGSYSLPISAGDLIHAKVVYTGGIGRRIICGWRFIAANAHEFIVAGAHNAVLTGDQFVQVKSAATSVIGSEALSNTIAGPTLITLDHFYTYLTPVPGVGAGRTLKGRKNTADGGPTVTYGAAEDGVKSDLVNSFELQNSDEVCTGFTTTGAPASATHAWAYRAIAEHSEGTGKPFMTTIGMIR